MSLEDAVDLDTSVPDSAPDPVSTPDPVAATPETPAAPASMEDTIRAKLREMNKPAEPEKPAGEQPRGPDGKFIKTAAEIAAEAAVAAETPPEAPVETPPVAPKPGEVDITKPPTSLKGAVQAKWSNLDPDVRSEFHRREADFHKGLSAYKEMAEIGKIMDAEVRPYEAFIRSKNLSAPAVVRDLMNTAYTLNTGNPDAKLQVVLNIAKEYGIDLSNVQEKAQQLATAAPQIDPVIAPLQQKLESIEKAFEQQRTEAAQREYAELQRETNAFATNPKNKFYEVVKLDMAALIETGRADGLQDAYDKAIWANPEARAQLLAEQQAAERKAKAEKAAAAKKAASTNVAPRGTLPAAPVVGSMEDTIRAKLRSMMSNS
jgi:hypothetical protein